MPRIKGCRHISGRPGAWYFKPQGIPLRDLDVQILEMDEFEALRLADLDGLYQDEAAKQMGISRQSFGLIVKSARHKVAKALTQGFALEIVNDEETNRRCI